MSKEYDGDVAPSPSHAASALEALLTNVDVLCAVCFEVCPKNLVICRSGHSLCQDCTLHIYCTSARCPACRNQVLDRMNAISDLTKNALCALVIGMPGGIEAAKLASAGHHERERLRREHEKKQRAALEKVVGDLSLLSESLREPEEVRKPPLVLPVRWRKLREREGASSEGGSEKVQCLLHSVSNGN